MRNLELKARCVDLARAESTARALGAQSCGDLHQVDTYFGTPKGRLKLREFDDAHGELIFYQRLEGTALRWSDYYVAPVAACRPLRKLLSLALSVLQRVDKQRRLYVYRGARIHLDQVQQLGTFIEFEVPVGGAAEMEAEIASAIMRELMDAFGLTAADAIRASYSELLEPQGS
jgi:adenylate cyclase class IV